MTCFSNRKKIRGWPNQIKKIDCWFMQNLNPEIQPNDRVNYVKIWIDPWFRLVKRNPPLWYFRLILDRLDELFENWHKKYSTSDTPYDLQLWLFEKSYIQSELVCTPVQKKGDEIHYFFKCDENRQFPTERFSGKVFNHHKYNWTLWQDVEAFYENTDELTQNEVSELLKYGFTAELIFEGKPEEQKMYWKPIEYVWVGRKK